jgi:hypothetical protein
VTGVQTCALPIYEPPATAAKPPVAPKPLDAPKPPEGAKPVAETVVP